MKNSHLGVIGLHKYCCLCFRKSIYRLCTLFSDSTSKHTPPMRHSRLSGIDSGQAGMTFVGEAEQSSQPVWFYKLQLAKITALSGIICLFSISVVSAGIGISPGNYDYEITNIISEQKDNALSFVQKQKSAEKKTVWVNIGFGVSSIGLSSGISCSYQMGKGILSCRHTYNEEFRLVILMESCPPPELAWDLGLLYGSLIKTKYSMGSCAVGLSIVRGNEPFISWERETKYFTTIGIPVEIQLFFTPVSFAGIGLYSFANLNLKKTFIGILFCLQIGKLR